MKDFLGISVASKDTLIEKLNFPLQMPEFCGQKIQQFEQTGDFLANLVDDISFVIEFPYVDRHYRDTYYSFYSSKFAKIGRNCVRVHIFEGTINDDDIFNKESKLNDRYRGFFIVRPLMRHILGRSLISPKAFKENKFVCCLMKARVSLFGNEFIIHGFPHISQDEETHTCAESALWGFNEYYGSKYSYQYKPLLPSQVIKPLQENAERRILPSRGLTEKELARCLNSNGFQSLVYSIVKYPKHKSILRLLNIYVESGFPLLLTLTNNKNGHVVLVIGHEDDDVIYHSQGSHSPWAQYDRSSWVDVSFVHKRLVFIDDNLPPYYIANLFDPKQESCLKYREWTVSSFIVPLPPHMFLVAETVYDLVKSVFNDPMVGLERKGGKWITRLLLTSSYSFKKFIFGLDSSTDNNFRKRLLRLPLPRFIWIVEIYRAQEFVRDGYCSGLLIIDATGDGKSLASVLFYIVDNNIFTHNGFVWDNEPKLTINFKMRTYKNNLKGEWNQWMS